MKQVILKSSIAGSRLVGFNNENGQIQNSSNSVGLYCKLGMCAIQWEVRYFCTCSENLPGPLISQLLVLGKTLDMRFNFKELISFTQKKGIKVQIVSHAQDFTLTLILPLVSQQIFSVIVTKQIDQKLKVFHGPHLSGH